MASSSRERENVPRSKKRSWDDLYRAGIGRDSLDSLSTTSAEGGDQVMRDPDELVQFISRILRKWREGRLEVAKERIKDIVRNEGGSSDEEKNEPTGKELGRISPAIGELLVGWGNAWCVDTKNDIYNRHSMLLEDRASADAKVVLRDWDEFIERELLAVCNEIKGGKEIQC